MTEEHPKRFTPISEAVYSWLFDIQEDESRYEQGLHWALECYDELKTSLHIGYKFEKLPITARKTVEYPCDMLLWLRLWVYHMKRWQVFTNNPSIPLSAKEIVDSLPELHKAPVREDIAVSVNTNHYGQDTGKLFGIRAYRDGVGYYKEYDDQKEWMLSSRVINSGYVYLEYVSNGEEPDQDTMIPRTAVKVIKNYLHWMSFEHNPNVNKQRLAERKRELYHISLENYVAMENPMTLEDISEALFESYTLAPKM